MALSTRPFLAIYVVWHPNFRDGPVIAKALHDHYRREIYKNVSGGFGFSVIYRSTPDPGSNVPIGINFDEAETSAIVLLIDEKLTKDQAWVTWVSNLMDSVDAIGLGTRVFPVAINGDVMKIGIAEQALRWDKWIGIPGEMRKRRLISSLTYQFCRMLRCYLERLKRAIEEEEVLEQYLRKVEIFLSHSKHDAHGERIAEMIRNRIYQSEGMDSFFDVYDIPAGLRFDKVIMQKIRVSAVVAIHTDSYSSREWCRREIIEAKRWNVPLVVANCIIDLDERSFPYMGNVPIVRMELEATDRIDFVVSRLLDEILKDFIWRCRIQLATDSATNDVVFLPRSPELITLAGLPKNKGIKTTLVYPDPPIGAEEHRLFEAIAPTVRLRSIIEWIAESGK